MFNPAVDGEDLWSDEDLAAELEAIKEADFDNANDCDLDDDEQYNRDEICDLAGMYDCDENSFYDEY